MSLSSFCRDNNRIVENPYITLTMLCTAPNALYILIHSVLYEVGTVIIPVSQMRKLRLRGVEDLPRLRVTLVGSGRAGI